jgi:hypothetical protein
MSTARRGVVHVKDIKATKAYLWLCVIIAVTAVIYYSSFRKGHTWGGDFAQYIYQAKGIAEGRIDEVLRASDYRYEKSTEDLRYLGPRYYPWGFPVLLSPIYRIFGLNLTAMKAYTSAFFLFSLLVMFLLFNNRLTYTETLFLVAVFALNPLFFHFKDYVMSDVPFLFFTLLAMYLIQRIVVDKKTRVHRHLSYAALGLFIFLSYYTRSAGGLLIPVLLICQYVDQRRSAQNILSYVAANKSAFVPYLVFFALVVISGLILPGYMGSYYKHISYFGLKRAIGNVYHYFMVPSDFFGPFMFSMVIYGITIPFSVLGIAKNLRKDYHYLAFLVLTLILVIPYPGRQHLRYVFQLLPFWMYFVFVGLSRTSVSEIIPARYNRLNMSLLDVVSIVLILVFGTVIFLIRSHRTGPSLLSAAYEWKLSDSGGVVEGPYTKDSAEMFDYIRTNTSIDDVVIFRKPRVMTLYTDRLSIAVLGYDGIVASDARYVVLARELDDQQWKDSLIHEHEEDFELLFENKSLAIYEIKGRRQQ